MWKESYGLRDQQVQGPDAGMWLPCLKKRQEGREEIEDKIRKIRGEEMRER
jgi:hypothetical protein